MLNFGSYYAATIPFYFIFCPNVYMYVIKHDLDCSTTTSTCFKGLFHFFLGETKPMRDKGLYINLSASKELQTQWPGVLVAKHPHHIHLPAFTIMRINLRLKKSLKICFEKRKEKVIKQKQYTRWFVKRLTGHLFF
ncbi:hypothetical protein CUMW_058030 [Citrus unshiu]|nr:hypothetical protein CUMW_058030 [Citrus unshiu]